MGGNELLLMVGYMVIIFAVFYFVAVRPQNKKEKQHKALIESVAAGDCILTSSGFYGVVLDVSDEIVIVEFGNNKNCRIPMKKEAILEVEKANSED